MKRGRPPKIRPVRGSCEIQAGMSQRDMAIAVGISRAELSKWIAMAEIPEERFEAALESDEPKAELRHELLLVRHRAGKATEYERCCPHCGGLLRVEGLT